MEGKKYDSGKPEISLLPPWALEEVAKVLTVGAKKYAPDNWKRVPDGEYRYKNALGRHFIEFLKGNELDEETGLHHLAHLICCAMFILDSRASGVPLAQSETKEKADDRDVFYLDVSNLTDEEVKIAVQLVRQEIEDQLNPETFSAKGILPWPNPKP